MQYRTQIHRNKRLRRMTILPDKRYFSVRQRVADGLYALIRDFRDWYRGDLRLPDWWKPKHVETSGRGSGD
jgi:hypothetical protein